MDILKTFGPIIGQVAPSIASALGGPLAGTAVKYLSQAFFGHGNASAEELNDAMQNASPDQLVSLKQIDADFKAKMAQIGVDLERIAADDRKSARDMQKETKDWIPRALAVSVRSAFLRSCSICLSTVFRPQVTKRFCSCLEHCKRHGAGSSPSILARHLVANKRIR